MYEHRTQMPHNDGYVAFYFGKRVLFSFALSSDILDIFVNPNVRKKPFYILAISNQFFRPDEMMKCCSGYSHNLGNGRYAYCLFNQALMIIILCGFPTISL